MVDLLAAREDAELQQKFSSELQDIPNTIPAFKCVLPNFCLTVESCHSISDGYALARSFYPPLNTKRKPKKHAAGHGEPWCRNSIGK